MHASCSPTFSTSRLTIFGMPPLARSRRKFWAPLNSESPPVSNARLSAAGLVGRKLVGASDAVMMLAR